MMDFCQWNESIGEFICDCNIDVCGDVFVRGMSSNGSKCLFEYCGHTSLLQNVMITYLSD